MHGNVIGGEAIADYRMDDNVCRAACAALGANTERSRAALTGVSVNTLIRWRLGSAAPRLDLVDAVCQRLGISRSSLFPGLAASFASAEAAEDQAITEAAEKIAANWPALDDGQRAELSRIMSATALPRQRKAPEKALDRAA